MLVCAFPKSHYVQLRSLLDILYAIARFDLRISERLQFETESLCIWGSETRPSRLSFCLIPEETVCSFASVEVGKFLNLALLTSCAGYMAYISKLRSLEVSHFGEKSLAGFHSLAKSCFCGWRSHFSFLTLYLTSNEALLILYLCLCLQITVCFRYDSLRNQSNLSSGDQSYDCGVVLTL